MAVVEEALRSLSQNQSLLIHNPLPGNRIPVAICLAYTRSQDPRFPTHGIVGKGDSMFALPALNKGYLSTIDDAQLDGIGRSPCLIDRQSIGALSEWSGDAELYTTNHGFKFHKDRLAPNTGAVFVDPIRRLPRELLHTVEAAKEQADSNRCNGTQTAGFDFLHAETTRAVRPTGGECLSDRFDRSGVACFRPHSDSYRIHVTPACRGLIDTMAPLSGDSPPSFR